ncbi:MAG: galactokinase [Sedimentisphaerales bacterium]
MQSKTNNSDKETILKKFCDTFGTNAQIISSAGGRAELIGGHTDYNEGFVIACAIDKSFSVVARARSDKKIIMYSDWANAVFEFELSANLKSTKEAKWANYGIGVAVLLAEAGLLNCGADILITGNVPVGTGLSSSAALEVSIANALLSLGNNENNISKNKLAALCQKAENKFANSPCGIMDQMVVLNGRKDHTLLLDCRSLAVEQLPFDTKNFCIIVFNSMVRHEVGAGNYGSRKQQCQKALEIIQKKYPFAKTLRDIDTEKLADFKKDLDQTLFKRASHVVGENARVLAAADALKSNDMKKIGSLMHQSHCSARDLYEISCKEIDFLVEKAVEYGALGARLCGGGFGGAVVAIADAKTALKIKEKVFADFKKRFGIDSEIYIVSPCDGTGILRL